MFMYHFWERRFKEFLTDQLQLLGEVKPKTEGSAVEHSRRVLEQVFDCFIEDVIWSQIDEVRKVTNALKHGGPAKFATLRANYPVYFDAGPESDVPADDFLITKESFVRLTTGIRDFWEFMPHRLDLHR